MYTLIDMTHRKMLEMQMGLDEYRKLTLLKKINSRLGGLGCLYASEGGGAWGVLNPLNNLKDNNT